MTERYTNCDIKRVGKVCINMRLLNILLMLVIIGQFEIEY